MRRPFSPASPRLGSQEATTLLPPATQPARWAAPWGGSAPSQGPPTGSSPTSAHWRKEGPFKGTTRFPSPLHVTTGVGLGSQECDRTPRPHEPQGGQARWAREEPRVPGARLT